MVLKQIKCPPTGKGYGMNKFVKKWLPGMELYAMDYIGVGDMIGTTKNKVARRVALGNNSFMSIGGTCGSSSDSECVGQERNMYLKSYPLGSIPTCIEKKRRNICNYSRRPTSRWYSTYWWITGRLIYITNYRYFKICS